MKNIPLTTLITLGQPSCEIIDWLKRNKLITLIETCQPFELSGKWKIFVNGTWIGVSGKAKTIMNLFKTARINEEIHRHTTLTFSKQMKELFIWSDSGRTVRPLFKVKDGRLPFTAHDFDALRKGVIEYNWNSLLDKGWIEYMDSAETMQSSVRIAIFPWQITNNHSHCELHPILIFGVVASLVPFCDHNQAPRNTYQCKFILTYYSISNLIISNRCYG